MDERMAAAAEESQVRTQMNGLDQGLSELEKALAELKNRLASVLRGDEGDGIEKEKGDVELSLVPLATDIREYSHRIESTLSVVRGILRTLEL